MPKCKENCQAKELFTAFLQTDTGRQIGAAWLMSAARDFCRYVDSCSKLPCDINLADMTGFIKQLNSLESPAFTADDIHREIHHISLFYDYLQGIGCVTDNPVEQLRKQETEQLVKYIKSIYRREKSDD